MFPKYILLKYGAFENSSLNLCSIHNSASHSSFGTLGIVTNALTTYHVGCSHNKVSQLTKPFTPFLPTFFQKAVGVPLSSSLRSIGDSYIYKLNGGSIPPSSKELGILE